MKTFQPLMAAAVVTLLVASGTAEAARKPKTTTPSSSSTTSSESPSAAKHGVGKGDSEIGFFMDYQHFDGAGTNFFLLGGVFGKFLRDTVEMRVTPVITYISSSGGLKSFGFDPYVTVEKLFPNSTRLVPYVGGGIGLTINYSKGTGFNSTDLGLFVTPVAGLKFFVSERTSLEYALSYQIGFISDYTTTSGVYSTSTTSSGNTNTLQNTLRFNIYF